MKKEKFTTNLLAGILTVIVMWAALSSCSPKYGCSATKGKVGYYPYQKR